MSVIIMKRGASVRCQIEGCNGKPKKLLTSTNVEPYKCVKICKACFCVHEYEPLTVETLQTLIAEPGVEQPPVIVKKKKKKKTGQINLEIE